MVHLAILTMSFINRINCEDHLGETNIQISFLRIAKEWRIPNSVTKNFDVIFNFMS